MKASLCLGIVCAVALPGFLCRAQDNAPGVPVTVLATVEAKQGRSAPEVSQGEVHVKEAGAERQVTAFSKAGPDTGLQLMLLIDDSSRGSFDTEIGTLKQWINSLPANVEVAVGYMRNGMADLVSKFTTDHAAAANSVRLVLGPGGADVSPYDSLSDAVKKWPKSEAVRKEVVMISSGMEGLGGGWAPENPYVNKGIADAQKAGVVVFTIYNPSVGHAGHAFWSGQSFLSQLSDETGGESYITTFSSPVSFEPFLQDITAKLQNQYLLTFIAKAENKAGLQSMHASVENKNADILAPSKVFVKASK